MKTTISVIKADVGSIPGHVKVPEELLEIAEKSLKVATQKGIIKSYHVTNCGDDLELIMSHDKGEDNPKIHELAWETFKKAAALAKKRKYYGAGQDLLVEAFSGNVRGMGPGVAEFEIEERPSEPIIVLMCDKTSPSAFNLPFYKIFADPFNTAGLVIDSKIHGGFRFEVHDIKEGKRIFLNCPEEIYDLLALIGLSSRYAIKRVFRRDGVVAAVASTERLSFIAGKYVGKDDPVAITRAQSGFPAVGEILEAFAFPQLVPGWMRGSHRGPLMPVSREEARPTRFDGPPRIMAYGFQVCEGELIGPVDLFGDPSFDLARQQAIEVSEYIRRHGPFEPHLLSPEELEYTTLPEVIKKLKDRFEPIKK
ncbi:MAG: fructose-1,6-bisphosphate aldolase/phosphatase [Candidatus Hadarchaeum sp.]|uniref:fructose-1,6-bisphosphate aldolase/phosphatase n=1 Tax=Candidatus Hadarchaeum sp. TaxID=2883567 RepID=UPI003178A6C7